MITGTIASGFVYWLLSDIGEEKDCNQNSYGDIPEGMKKYMELIENAVWKVWVLKGYLAWVNKLKMLMKLIKNYLNKKNLLENLKDMFCVYCSIYENLLKLILGDNVNNFIPSYVMFGSDDDNNKGSLDKGKGKAIDEYPDSGSDKDSDSSDTSKKFLDKGKGKEVDSSPSPVSAESNSRKRKRDDNDLEESNEENQVQGSLTEEQAKILRDLEFKHLDPNANYNDPYGEAEKRYEKIKADLDKKLTECSNKEQTSEVESEIDKLNVVRDHIEGQRFERKLAQLEDSYTENPAKRTKVESMDSDLEEGEWETWDPWESKQETRSDQSSEQAESSRARCTEEEHRRLDKEYEETKEQRKTEFDQKKIQEEEQRKQQEREELMREEEREEEKRQAELDNSPDGLYEAFLDRLAKIAKGWFYLNDKFVPPVPPWKESEKKPYSATKTESEINSNVDSKTNNTSNTNTTENSSVNTISSSTSVPDNTTYVDSNTTNVSSTDTTIDNTSTDSLVENNTSEGTTTSTSASRPRPIPDNPETTSELPQDSSVSSNTEDGDDKSKRKKELSNDFNSSNDNNTSKRVSIDQDVNIEVLDKPIYQDTTGQNLDTPISPYISQDLRTPISPNNGQYLETPVSDSQVIYLIKPIPKSFIEWCQDIFIGIPVDNGSPIDYVVDQITCDMPTYMWDDGD